MPETPGTESVSDLLQKVHDGSFVIPYFQRGFEWEPRMVCDLFESILQNYFTGLLLLWQLDHEDAKNEEWDPVWGAEKRNTPEVAILDGQQRLSSLYYAIFNPKKIFPNRQSYYVFFIDLNKVLNEEFEGSVSYRFFFSNHQSWEELKKDQKKWAKDGIVPLSILSAVNPEKPDKPYIKSTEFASWIKQYLKNNKSVLPPDTNELTVFQVLDDILEYSFVFFPLGSDRDLQDICNIFARVNSKGMKLSTFDLLNAFLYPKDVHLRKDLWENLDNEALKAIDSSMNEYILKCISLVKQNYCSAKYLFNLIPGETTTRKDDQGQKYEETLVQDGKEFKKLWKLACQFSESARKRIMNTGKGDFGAIKQSFIPNTTLVPVIAALLWEYSGDPDNIEFVKYMQKWYWSAVFSEDYSGSSDSVMAKDFRDWKDWISHGNEIERVHRVNLDFFQELDLKSVKKSSARYNAILCLLALNNAKDFYKGQIVGSVDYSNENINDHHIFPNKVSGLSSQKSGLFSTTKDSIVNRTLLLDETNQSINNRRPSEYFDEILNKFQDMDAVLEMLEGHFINKTALGYLMDDDYDRFITERERSIKKFIIKTLDVS